jgi:hypothetical protein
MRKSYIIEWVVPNRKIKAPSHTIPVKPASPVDYLFPIFVLVVFSYFGWGIINKDGHKMETRGVDSGQSSLYHR